MKQEIWKPVDGFDGKLEVSDRGRARRRLPTNSIVMYGLSPKSSGYVAFEVRLRGTDKYVLLHRAVLLAFVGPCPKGFQCDHINGNKQDNRLENLEWVTCKENNRRKNIRHAGAPWARGELHGHSRLNDTKVRIARACYRMQLKRGWIRILADAWDVWHPCVGRAASGEAWKHVGES